MSLLLAMQPPSVLLWLGFGCGVMVAAPAAWLSARVFSERRGRA